MKDAPTPKTDEVWDLNITTKGRMTEFDRAVHYFRAAEKLRDHAQHLERENDRIAVMSAALVKDIWFLRKKLTEQRKEAGRCKNVIERLGNEIVKRNATIKSAMVKKYAAVSFPSKAIFTPFFHSVDELETWIDNSDCEPLNMARLLGINYDIVHTMERVQWKELLTKC
jgi:hypothetical protein